MLYITYLKWKTGQNCFRENLRDIHLKLKWIISKKIYNLVQTSFTCKFKVKF